jgi:hypothetical protein
LGTFLSAQRILNPRSDPPRCVSVPGVEAVEVWFSQCRMGAAGRCATDNGLGNPVRRKHCNACLRLRTTKIIVSGPIELRVNGPDFREKFYSRVVFRFRAWRRRDKGSPWNCPIFAGQRIVETGHSVGAQGDARNTRRRACGTERSCCWEAGQFGALREERNRSPDRSRANSLTKAASAYAESCRER